MNDSWLSVGEAASFLGVSISTLRHWTDEGHIDAFRTVGGHRRYLRSRLIEFRRQSEEQTRQTRPVKSERRRP